MGRTWKKAAAVAAVAAVMLLLLAVGGRALHTNYIFWNGMLLSRSAETLDISGRKLGRDLTVFLELPRLRQLDARDTRMTAEEYRWFEENLPDCRILWDIPIQGVYYGQTTQQITASALTEQEREDLQYLTALQTLDLRGWDDYAAIDALHQRYPALKIAYDVSLGGQRWDGESVSLVIENADAAELAEKLGRFPRLQSLLLTGQVPPLAELESLRQTWPEIFFLWKMDWQGMTLETDITVLDLRNDPKAALSLEELLPYLPNLTAVELDGCHLTAEDLIRLSAEYPGIHFRSPITVGEHTVHTADTHIDLSNTAFASFEEASALLAVFRDLEEAVLCRSGLDSPTMERLNRQVPGRRVVWSVNLAGMEFRTDAVHFTPNRWGLKCTDANIADLRYCTDMVCVDIGHAVNVTSCEFVKYMPKLKYLVLAETGISDLTPLTDHENLIFLELFLSKVKDYSPLTTCLALEDLNLCYTQGDYAPIARMTWLKRLWWSGSWLARKNLPDLLPETVYQEYRSLSSTGEGWRTGQHYYDMRDFIGMSYMTG